MKLYDILNNVRFGTKIGGFEISKPFECVPNITGSKFPLNEVYLKSEISCIYTDGESLCIEVYDYLED